MTIGEIAEELKYVFSSEIDTFVLFLLVLGPYEDCLSNLSRIDI